MAILFTSDLHLGHRNIIYVGEMLKVVEKILVQ